MEIEIIDEPIRFRLFGNSSAVENQRYGEVGLRLMNAMWKAVKDTQIQTTGINHWVYFADNRMFVGVEVKDSQRYTMPEGLSPLALLAACPHWPLRYAAAKMESVENRA